MKPEITSGTIVRFADRAGFEFDGTGEIMQWDGESSPELFPTGSRMIMTEIWREIPSEDRDFPNEIWVECINRDLTYE